MTFSVNDIRSQLTYGGARPSHFQVQITNPIDSAANLKIPFLTQASSIPDSTIGMIEIPYFGRKIKLAGDRVFDEWTVTVMNDEDFLIRTAMEKWLASINSHETNLRSTASPTDYKSQAQVIQFSKTGVALRTYNFVGLFPSAVAPIELDWETTDDIERFDVTFQYDYWTVNDRADQGESRPANLAETGSAPSTIT